MRGRVEDEDEGGKDKKQKERMTGERGRGVDDEGFED